MFAFVFVTDYTVCCVCLQVMGYGICHKVGGMRGRKRGVAGVGTLACLTIILSAWCSGLSHPSLTLCCHLLLRTCRDPVAVRVCVEGPDAPAVPLHSSICNCHGGRGVIHGRVHHWADAGVKVLLPGV